MANEIHERSDIDERNARQGFVPENDLDFLFGYGNPNPERDGCPTADVLAVLSRRELPIGDVRYDHLSHCSPCFREFRALQQRAAARRSNAGRRIWSFLKARPIFQWLGSVLGWVRPLGAIHDVGEHNDSVNRRPHGR